MSNKNSIHRNLDYFKQWVDVDVNDEEIKNKLFDMIDDDKLNDSPTVIHDINNGKYSPYKKYLSEMAKTQLYCMKIKHMFNTSALTLLAAAKFKRSTLKNKNSI